MNLFLFFFLPFVLPIIAAIVLIALEIMMIYEVVENEQLTKAKKFLWTIAMVPFLPITAVAYIISGHLHHHSPLST